MTNSCSSIISLLLTALLTLIPGYTPSSSVSVQPAPTITPFPTTTLAPTATLNPVAFDLGKATVYKDKDNIIEMLLPGGWIIQPSSWAKQFVFTYGPSSNESIVLQIVVDTPDVVYSQTLQITGLPDSPKAALETFKAQVSVSGATAVLKWGNVEPVKIGVLDGQGLVVSALDEPAREYEFRIASLADGQVVYVYSQMRSSLLETAKPVLYKMLDSLVIKPQNIPTATPTPTLHPLLITATALQKQIDALTPPVTLTATPLPTTH